MAHHEINRDLTTKGNQPEIRSVGAIRTNGVDNGARVLWRAHFRWLMITSSGRWPHADQCCRVITRVVFRNLLHLKYVSKLGPVSSFEFAFPVPGFRFRMPTAPCSWRLLHSPCRSCCQLRLEID